MTSYILGSGWPPPEGDKILVQRNHTYDGHLYVGNEPATFIGLDSDKVVLTAAVGSLNPLYAVGDIVIIQDVLTLFYQSHIIGPEFQDMDFPFDGEMRLEAARLAREQGRTYHLRATHAFVRGPHYESHADRKALRVLGADVVGMSILPELLQAKKEGKRVLGLAVVSNTPKDSPNHDDVLKNVQEANLGEYLTALNKRLAKA